METLFKIELVVDKTGREETFPMQEQDQGPVTCRDEKPVAGILAERAAEAGFGIATPLFVP